MQCLSLLRVILVKTDTNLSYFYLAVRFLYTHLCSSLFQSHALHPYSSHAHTETIGVPSTLLLSLAPSDFIQNISYIIPVTHHIHFNIIIPQTQDTSNLIVGSRAYEKTQYIGRYLTLVVIWYYVLFLNFVLFFFFLNSI